MIQNHDTSSLNKSSYRKLHSENSVHLVHITPPTCSFSIRSSQGILPSQNGRIDSKEEEDLDLCRMESQRAHYNRSTLSVLRKILQVSPVPEVTEVFFFFLISKEILSPFFPMAHSWA